MEFPYQSAKASPPKIMVKNSDGSSVTLSAFCNHYYSMCISIPNPLLGIAPSLPYLSYAARSWSSLSIWYASPICHLVSPAVLVEYRAGSPDPLLVGNKRTSWNFACAVSSPGFLSTSGLVPGSLKKVVAQCTGVQFNGELAVRLLDFEFCRGRR